MAAHRTGHRSARRRTALVAAAFAVGATLLVPTAASAGSPPSADLSVTASHTPNSGVTGDEFDITIVATNDGPDTAEGVAAGLGADYPLESVDLPDECRRSASYTSFVCDLGDLASGEVAEVTITLRAQGSGLYTLPVAIASDTADPDTADLVSSLTILVKPGPTQAERYISGIFPIILDRPVDPGALQYWSVRWRNEYNRWPRNLAKIPGGIIGSNEYRRLRIHEAYQHVLGRPADPAALTSFVAKIVAGWTYQQVERHLLITPEFARRTTGDSGDFGADWVQGVYQKVMGRSAGVAELDAALAAVGDRGFIGRQQLVQFLQSTTEARDLVIAEKFQDTLGEAPSPLGRYVWHYRLRQGDTPERLWAELLVSWDVLRDYPFTEDDYLYPEGSAQPAARDFTDALPDVMAAIAE